MNLNTDLKKPSDFLQYNLRISDFSDLSIGEILILQSLQKYSKPVVRYSLYLEVKNHLQNEKLRCESDFLSKFSEIELRFYQFLQKEKKLSASSFYNSLSNLEEKGLIRYVKDQEEKIISIEPSKLTNPALNFLNQYFTLMMIDDFKFDDGFSQKIKKKIGNKKYETGLIISPQGYLELEIINCFKEEIKKLYFLGKNFTVNILKKVNIAPFEVSTLYNQMIREPNDIFDIIIIPNYCRNPDLFGLSNDQLIKECIRVTKINGYILIIGREKVDPTNNFYANKLINHYNELFNRKGQIFSRYEIEDILGSINLKEIEIIEDKGLIVGIGKV